MRLGIDASNLRVGGGVTHLTSLLNNAKPHRHGFQQVTVWSGCRTIEQLPEKSWLKKVHVPDLDGKLASRVFWQRRILPRLASEQCDCLFAPGGTCGTTFRPVITMSRNMLPFEMREVLRYRRPSMLARNVLLRSLMTQSYRKADGVIFLTDYAHQIIGPSIGNRAQATIIPHGVDRRFMRSPAQQESIDGYFAQRPFRFLYASTLDVYKHQWHVVQAIAELRRRGFPVALDLMGAGYQPAVDRLKQTIHKYDPDGEFTRYQSQVPHEQMPAYYQQADAFIFASSCENMPNILLEAMASGLPIACSNRGPMPGILGADGLYFDPLQPGQITAALRKLLQDPAGRFERATGAFETACRYSWEQCADETFDFLASLTRPTLETSTLPIVDDLDRRERLSA